MPPSHVPSRPALSTLPSFRTGMRGGNVLADGWCEQQRRRRLRFVWKEVHCSLVKQGDANLTKEGSGGMDLTFWVHRRVISPSGTTHIHPLHQIPVKYIEEA